MNPVRIGIIGFGNQGSAYVRLIQGSARRHRRCL